MLSFRMYFVANTVHKRVEKVETIPQTWRDAIKDRFFRYSRYRWLRPRYRDIETEIHFVHACPHLDFDGRRAHVEFLTPSGGLR